MSLTLGTRLGVYEVTAKIDESGMGEVYQAHDTTLDRGAFPPACGAERRAPARHPPSRWGGPVSCPCTAISRD
jgi:hypothetical protein